MNSTIRRFAALGATTLAVSAAAIAGLGGTGGADTTPPTGQIKVDKVVVGTTTTQKFAITVTCDNNTFFDVLISDADDPWGTTLPAGVTCTVNEPTVAGFTTTYTGNPATIVGGSIVTVTVTNTFVPPPPPPSWTPRTRGYWRNHCENMNLPISLGSFNVSNCATVESVFAAGNGRFMENQLAAQLLAAKANVAEGSSTCINNAIAGADALLTTIGYSGPPSSIIDDRNPLRSRASNLKNALDAYNNNGCA